MSLLSSRIRVRTALTGLEALNHAIRALLMKEKLFVFRSNELLEITTEVLVLDFN